MDTTWKTTASGEVIYSFHTPLQARLIIGAMLSFFAVFFGYYLFSGLIEYLRVATAREWLDALPGFLVILALFLLFAVPAWIALVGRSKLVVDPSSGSIAEVFDLWIYRRAKRYHIDEVKTVRISRKTFRTKGHSSQANAVEIVLRNDTVITVTYEDQIEDARAVATQMANTFSGLQVPVEESAGQKEDLDASIM